MHGAKNGAVVAAAEGGCFHKDGSCMLYCEMCILKCMLKCLQGNISTSIMQLLKVVLPVWCLWISLRNIESLFFNAIRVLKKPYTVNSSDSNNGIELWLSVPSDAMFKAILSNTKVCTSFLCL